MSQAAVDVGTFFHMLFGDAPEPGWVTLATYPNGIFDPNPRIGPTREMWFRWPEQADELIATASSNKKHDLYFCPVLFKAKPYTEIGENGKTVRRAGRRIDNAQWTGCVYADADDAQPQVFKLVPSLTVQTSPDKHHLYWVLNKHDGNPVEASRRGRAMAYAHEGCDLGGWDITQLLRVPSTTNNKPSLEEPFRTTVRTSGSLYTLEEIDKKYPPAKAPDPAKDSGVDIVAANLPDYATTMAKIFDNALIVDLLNARGRAPSKGRSGNRSDLLWKLMCELAEAGLSAPESFVLAWPVHYNKFRTENRGRKPFWEQLAKAYAHVGKQPATEPEPQDQPPAPSPRQLRDHAVYLMSEQERREVPETLVDRYVAWASTKTDAAPQFHEAAIFTILSCVFGEYGKPATQFDSGGLNTWFMVLGGTTMSRKSTVRKMMTTAIRHLSDETYDYDLGSNATMEGLHNEMLQRPGLSSLFHRDEVHGLVGEQKAKQYLSGLQELMTELYDGTVPGKLRATGDKKRMRAVPGNFVMYLTGATEHATKAYTEEDFESGHLARFLYVYADPPELTRENSYMAQASESDEFQLSYGEAVDRTYQHLIEQIKGAREFWHGKIRRGQHRKIFWEANAWERMNEAQYRAMMWATKHPMSGALVPTTQRSMIAMIRIATLLAMVDESEKVQMSHLLRAMKFTEECLTHLVLILGKMKRTKRSSAQDAILAELSVHPDGLPHNKLYSKFRGSFTSDEFKALMRDLIESGELEAAGKMYKRRE